MGKPLRDEDLRLNIIVNGDAGRKALDDLKRSVADSKAHLGGLIAKQKELERQGEYLTPEYKQLTAEIDRKSAAHDKETERLKNLIRLQSLEKMTLRELQQHYRATTMALRNAAPESEVWRKLRFELQQTDARIKELKGTAVASEGIIKRMAGGFSQFFGAFTAGFASMSFAAMGIKKARTSFLEYDEALTDAQKTTNSTKTEIREVSNELKKIDTRTAQNSLLDIVRVAGKLGIEGVQNLVEFARAGDKIGVALARDLGGNAEAAIQQIGKLVDIFHLKETFGIETSMLKVGSAINELGMASTASEGYIVEFAGRAAGIAPNVDISIQSVLGLGATLDKLKQTAETSGTTYGQVITAMYKRTEVFAKIAKMSLGDFRKLMAEDMNEAFIRVLEGMGKSGNGMQSIVDALNSMKLDGQRSVQVLGVLAANTDELRRQQDLANRAFEDGTSIIKEFGTKNESATASFEKQKKALAEQAVILGETLNPAFTSTTSIGVTFLKAITAIVKMLYATKGAIIPAIAVYASFALGLKAAATWKQLLTIWSAKHRIELQQEIVTINAATTSTKLMAVAQNLLTGNFRLAGIAAKAFFASLGPVGWIITGISALSSAYLLFSGRVSAAAKFQELLSDNMRDAASEAAKERTELDLLKGKLEGCKVGTKEYNSAKQEIIDKFGKYDSTLKDETLTVQTLRDKYDSLTEAINQSAKTRQYNKFVEAKQTSFDEQFGEISDKLWKHLNDSYYTEKASKYYNQIVSAFFGGRSLDAWLTTGSGKSQRLIRQLQELRTEQDKADKEARARFGITNTTSSTTTQLPDKRDPNPDPLPLSTDEKGKWSLNKDAAFLEAKKNLREKYAAGDKSSEQLYQDELLKIEIDALRKRLAANKETGAAREKIAVELAEKLTEQNRREVQKTEAAENLRLQNITDATERENEEYKRRQKEFAGNDAALEQLAIQHNRTLTQIQMQKAMSAIQQLESEYKQERKIIQERHRVDLQQEGLTGQQKKQLRQQQNNELKEFDENYLQFTIAQLKGLNIAGSMVFRDLKGIIQDIDLDTSLLSEEEKNKLLARIQELEAAYEAARQKMEEAGYSFSGQKAVILGFSEDDWGKFFENLKAGKFGAKEMGLALGAAANAAKMAMDLYSGYDKMMTAKENAEFKRYQKNQDKKKKINQTRVKSGLMTEEQASAEEERMQAEADAKQEELQIKQAKRQKAMSLGEAIINTAVGVAAALRLGWPIGVIMAAVVGAMGAAQIAMIASTPVAGAEVGGPVVERLQDGRKFNAKYAPNKRGFISSPTVLVSENGTEYVVPGDAMRNPTLIPVLNTIEAARRHGTLSSFDFNAVYRQQPQAPGFSTGGPTGPMPSFDTTTTTSLNGMDAATAKLLCEAVNKLILKLDDPVKAYVTLLGKNGIKEMIELEERNRKRGQLG